MSISRSRYVTLLAAVLALVLALSVPSRSRAESVPIEGMLLVVAYSELGERICYFMDGTSDAIVPSPIFFDVSDISPDMSKVAYSVRSDAGWFLAETGEIWVAETGG